MRITIKGRHWRVTPDFREYAVTRIEKLLRYFSHLASVQLTVTQEGYRHLAELCVLGNGVDLRGRAQDSDPRVALDQVVAQQEQALKRRKDRLKDRKKRGQSLRKDAIPEVSLPERARREAGVDVVRVRPRQRALTVDQAARALLRSKQTVLAFSEPDGGGWRVAYRLAGGQVGLLELD